jgi:hypothetical protein
MKSEKNTQYAWRDRDGRDGRASAAQPISDRPRHSSKNAR